MNAPFENRKIDGKKTIEWLETIANTMMLNHRDIAGNFELLKEFTETMNAIGVSIPMLEFSLRQSIIYNWNNSKLTEFDVHEWFKDQGYKKLNNCVISDKESNCKHKPDFWLKRNEEFMPVEIKLHEFNARALSQLRRYMDFYKCEKGVAVGKSLNCILPENITFISYRSKPLKRKEPPSWQIHRS